MRNPSYKSGFAPRDGIPRYPSLWRGCVGAWCPGLGPSGAVLRDWSGRKNHGTLTNMDMGAAWQPGALAFDGTNDYVEIQPVTTSGPKTVAFWIKAAAAINAVIIGGAPSVNYFPYLTGSLLYVATPAESYDSMSSGSVTIGQWYHYALSSNGTTTSVFRNGTLVGTVGDRSPAIRAFGAYGDGSFPFNGSMDDIRIYNRALSNRESSLLATRRRIAYELAPSAFAPQSTTGNRRRRYLIGCS